MLNHPGARIGKDLQQSNQVAKLMDVSLASWADVCRDVVCSVDKRLDKSFIFGQTTCHKAMRKLSLLKLLFIYGKSQIARYISLSQGHSPSSLTYFANAPFNTVRTCSGRKRDMRQVNALQDK